MQADEYVKYQAFFRRAADVNYWGWIAHDTTHVEQTPGQHVGKHDTAEHAQ